MLVDQPNEEVVTLIYFAEAQEMTWHLSLTRAEGITVWNILVELARFQQYLIP